MSTDDQTTLKAHASKIADGRMSLDVACNCTQEERHVKRKKLSSVINSSDDEQVILVLYDKFVLAVNDAAIMIKNSPNRGLRSSPHLDPDVG